MGQSVPRILRNRQSILRRDLDGSRLTIAADNRSLLHHDPALLRQVCVEAQLAALAVGNFRSAPLKTMPAL